MSQKPIRLARRRPFQIQHPSGTCFTPNGPGQNYEVEAYAEGIVDPLSGMAVDVALLDQWMQASLEPILQNDWSADIGDLSAITARLAQRIFTELEPRLQNNGLSLVKVRLYQDKDLWMDVWA